MSGMPAENEAAFSVDEAILATGARLLAGGGRSARGVSSDTRQALEGKIFVALRGERFDGHRFALEAAERGAKMVLLDEPGADELEVELRDWPSECAALVVPDTTTALGNLALFHRNRWNRRVVAVAGSAGKTTTRTVVSSLLSQLRPSKVLSTVANFNNRIGVALTLLQLGDEHEICVLELGTNTPGEVAELARISRPDVGVVTLIDLEHTEGLGDLDGVEKEEGALFLALPESGTAIGFGDDPRVRRTMAQSPARTHVHYGEGMECEVIVKACALTDDLSGLVTLQLPEAQALNFRSTLLGLGGALAAAAAVCVARAVLRAELTPLLLEKAILVSGVSGRATLLKLSDRRLLIDDSYNANPASVRLTIRLGESLAAKTGGRLILVLGDMLELGGQSRAAHEEVGLWVGASSVSMLCTVGQEAVVIRETAADSVERAEHFDDARQVGEFLAPLLQPADVVVVKASRGVRAERIVRYLLDVDRMSRGAGGDCLQ